MVVCHCEYVNDRRIAEIVADRPDVTLEDITASCGAGGRCGGCHDSIEQLLDRFASTTPVRIAAA